MKIILASLLLSAIVSTGCASIKPALVTAGGAFVACGEADASGLFAQVGTIISANAANLEASLTALAATAGVDAVKCAIAAIDAALSSPSGSGVTIAVDVTGATIVTSKPAGLNRAKAWAAAR